MGWGLGLGLGLASHAHLKLLVRQGTHGSPLMVYQYVAVSVMESPGHQELRSRGAFNRKSKSHGWQIYGAAFRDRSYCLQGKASVGVRGEGLTHTHVVPQDAAWKLTPLRDRTDGTAAAGLAGVTRRYRSSGTVVESRYWPGCADMLCFWPVGLSISTSLFHVELI